jgi:hypothetical protein
MDHLNLQTREGPSLRSHEGQSSLEAASRDLQRRPSSPALQGRTKESAGLPYKDTCKIVRARDGIRRRTWSQASGQDCQAAGSSCAPFGK